MRRTRPRWENRIREIRQSKQMTQRDLARILGFTESYVSHLESGRAAPTAPTLQKLAAALGVKVDDLFVKSKGAKS
ncbi:MAG: helix-turn-helix transcriptional regulator [Candidatus Tectomicrobia bacterium]|nr:helix-turn-helix transcriptional regulator [Candidatus Tectomicrobia bacterium]